MVPPLSIFLQSISRQRSQKPTPILQSKEEDLLNFSASATKLKPVYVFYSNKQQNRKVYFIPARKRLNG